MLKRVIAFLLTASFLSSLEASEETPLTLTPHPLTPGHEVGSFGLTLTCNVHFSQFTDFPVTVHLLDYAGKSILSKEVTSADPFSLSTDLFPGSYSLFADAPKDDKYNSCKGIRLFLDSKGMLSPVDTGYDASLTFNYLRKIEVIYPGNLDTVSGATVMLDKEMRLPESEVVIKWKPIDAVKKYTVAIEWANNPYDPDEEGVGDSERYGVNGTELHFKENDGYFYLKTAYRVYIMDGSDDDEPPAVGKLAEGKTVFLTSGFSEEFKTNPPLIVVGHPVVDSRIGWSLEKEMPGSEGDVYVKIYSLAPKSIALLAGLTPETVIRSINGVKIEIPEQVTEIMAKSGSGTTVRVEVSTDMRGPTQTVYLKIP